MRRSPAGRPLRCQSVQDEQALLRGVRGGVGVAEFGDQSPAARRGDCKQGNSSASSGGLGRPRPQGRAAASGGPERTVPRGRAGPCGRAVAVEPARNRAAGGFRRERSHRRGRAGPEPGPLWGPDRRVAVAVLPLGSGMGCGASDMMPPDSAGWPRPVREEAFPLLDFCEKVTSISVSGTGGQISHPAAARAGETRGQVPRGHKQQH